MPWVTKKLVLWVVGSAAGLLGTSMAVQGMLSQQPPANLGLVDGKLRPCPPGSRTCVCSEASERDRRVQAFELRQHDGTTLDRIAGVIRGMPRARVITQSEHYLRAEFTSLIFRFVDDLELRFDPHAAQVHVRSASRVGKGDLGVNKKRVEELRERLRAAELVR